MSLCAQKRRGRAAEEMRKGQKPKILIENRVCRFTMDAEGLQKGGGRAAGQLSGEVHNPTYIYIYTYRSIDLSIYLSIYLAIYLVYSICFSIYISICLHIATLSINLSNDSILQKCPAMKSALDFAKVLHLPRNLYLVCTTVPLGPAPNVFRVYSNALRTWSDQASRSS